MVDADDDYDNCICNQSPFLAWLAPPLCPVGSNDNETLYLSYDGNDPDDDDNGDDDDDDNNDDVIGL